MVAGSGLALLTGALILVTRSLAPDALDGWGWRLPFLFGLVIGPVGLYIRRRLGETEAFLEAAAKEKDGFGRMVAIHLKIVVCIGLFSGQAISLYVILLYMPTFATTQLHLPLSEALTAQSIGLVGFTLLVPLFGALSDRIGQKPIFIGSLVLYLSVRLSRPLSKCNVPPVLLGSCKPHFRQSADHADRTGELAGSLFRPLLDGAGAAVSNTHARERPRYRRQRNNHDVRRLRTVLCYLVDRGDGFADCPRILRDIRRGN
jgi:MFS family permease